MRFGRLELHASARAADDAVDDGKPEARPRDAASRALAALERPHHAFALIFWQARAAVFHDEFGVLSDLVHNDREAQIPVFASAVARSVRKEVLNCAREFDRVRHDEVPGFQRHLGFDRRVALETRVVHRGLHGFAEVHFNLFGLASARIGEELRDDVFHLFEVAHHGVARFLRKVREFHFQTQTRDRRAKVVRDAREQKFTVRVHAAQVLHHAVEADVHGLNFGRSGILRQGIGNLPLTELFGAVRKRFQGLDHVPRQERSAEERREAGRHGPPDPARAVRGVEQFVGSL